MQLRLAEDLCKGIPITTSTRAVQTLAKGLRKGIRATTFTRGVQTLACVFIDICDPKYTEDFRGLEYTALFRDDATRNMWVYILRHMPDATEAFEQPLIDIRADGTLSTVECVRSDGGGEVG